MRIPYLPHGLVRSAFRRVPKAWANLPDLWLAVEVSGWHSRVYDRDFKPSRLSPAGRSTVWPIDLVDRTATSASTGLGEAMTAHDLEWQAPGFDHRLRVHLDRLFAEIDGDD